MAPTTVIDGRFELLSKAGEGGMGVVHRALDLTTGEEVAVKLLTQPMTPARPRQGPDRLERFRRESMVLEALNHPNIVRYVASGVELDHGPWLAMEWIEGRSLKDHLKEMGKIPPADAVALVAQIADALGEAHAKGVVHRDLKPANLILAGGRLDRVKVIDFGVAHLPRADQHTREGQLIGTPGYIAPEQARGLPVDARTDVYGLGCVLFRCVAGQLPFTGSYVNVLTKIVLEEAPPLGGFVDAPTPNLETLLMRMLSKRPEHRPLDGRALAAELRAVDLLGDAPAVEATVPQIPVRRRRRLSDAEQQVFTVVMARGLEVSDEPTLESASSHDPSSLSNDGTLHVIRLIDGTELAIVRGAGSATDQVARAAQWALHIAPSTKAGAGAIAVATGRGQLNRSVPVGDVIDRASDMLEETLSHADAPPDRRRLIRVDELTAALLPARFSVVVAEGVRLLKSDESTTFDLEALLQDVRPCVGRRKELRILEILAEDCYDEEHPQAALLLGDEGVGKSRVCQEFLRRLLEQRPRLACWAVGADPVRGNGPLSLIADLVRSGLRLSTESDSLVHQSARRVLGPDCDASVIAFLAELAGPPSPEPASAELAAARRDPLLMSEQMRRSVAALLEAQARRSPLLLLLEDLHGADRASLRMIEAALKTLPSSPILLLATGRPECVEAEPELWRSLDRQDLRIGALSPSAIRTLALQHLGEDVESQVIDAIVTQSGGNAFFAEELLRAHARGVCDRAPSTVLAMVEARIGDLDPSARRLLRAASVYGDRFWADALRCMVGPDFAHDEWLGFLVSEEWIVREQQSRLGDQEEFRFRHALVRQAAYEMLTAEDRKLAHQLAGQWLVRANSPDWVGLARHFQRGGRPKQASQYWFKAAQAALRASALQEAHEYCVSAEECGSEGRRIEEIWLLQCEIAYWLERPELLLQKGLELVGSMKEDDARWWEAQRYLLLAEQKLDTSAFSARARALIGFEGEPRNEAAYIKALLELLRYGDRLSSRDLLIQVEARLEALGVGDSMDGNSQLQGHLANAEAQRALNDADVEAHIRARQRAVECFRRAGHPLHELNAALNTGYGWMLLGDTTQARAAFESAMQVGSTMGVEAAVAMARHNLGLVLSWAGEHGRGRIEQELALAYSLKIKDARIECACRTYLARILRAAGDLVQATKEARGAAELGRQVGPPFGPPADATLAWVLHDQGEFEAALAHAHDAYAYIEKDHQLEEGRALIAGVYGRCLRAVGKEVEAELVMQAARSALMTRANRISDPRLKEGFLNAIPEHAELFLHSS